MRPIAAVVAASMLAAGSAGAWLPTVQAPDSPLDALASVDALLAADTWVERVQALPHSRYAGFEVPRFEEHRSIVQLVRDVYAHHDWPLSAAEETQLEAQAAALAPGVRHALQQLLGAVETGMRDWERATAAWTMEDWQALLALDPAAHDVPAGVNHILAKADHDLLMGSALRLLHALDTVTPHLQGPVSETDAALFPGPNEGLLFNDPMNVILVGGPGPSTYRTHTVPLSGIEEGSHVLILDVGGNDLYLNRAGSAHPLPRWVCISDWCNSGFPVSVAVDVSGDDAHTPVNENWPSLGGAVRAGTGILADLDGNDDYGLDGATGGQGRSFVGAAGMLLDAAGNDAYHMGSGGQGQAEGSSAVGLLMDLGGHDRYFSSSFAQGEGYELGTGFWVDVSGNDVVSASSFAQGRGINGGNGILLNIGGSDSYASTHTVRGAAEGCRWLPGQVIPGLTLNWQCKDSVAVFLDACGTESYVGWIGSNDAMWQQGNMGRGIDTNNLPVCASMV